LQHRIQQAPAPQHRRLSAYPLGFSYPDRSVCPFPDRFCSSNRRCRCWSPVCKVAAVRAEDHPCEIAQLWFGKMRSMFIQVCGQVLCHLEGSLVDNGRVRFCRKISGQLTMIVAELFLQMVVAIAFLQQGVAYVLFAAENGVDSGYVPLRAKCAAYPRAFRSRQRATKVSPARARRKTSRTTIASLGLMLIPFLSKSCPNMSRKLTSSPLSNPLRTRHFWFSQVERLFSEHMGHIGAEFSY